MTTYTVRSTSDSHYGRFDTLEAAEYALRMVRRIDPEAQIFAEADWRDRALAAEAAVERVREILHKPWKYDCACCARIWGVLDGDA